MWPPIAIITGIKMQLSYFIPSPAAEGQGVREVPVYTYFIGNIQFNYINHNLTLNDITLP